MQRAECDLDLLRFVVVTHDWDAFDDGVERGKPLLAIHDQEIGDLLLAIRTNRASIVSEAVLPKEEIADRVAAVHRVKQVPDFGVRPDKGALNVRQPDLAESDELDEGAEVVVDLLEESIAHA